MWFGVPGPLDRYFDAIAQIHVDRLTKGRMALLGDAGYGATRGGMGTGVAIAASYVLAGGLALAGGDHRTGFAAYESRIRDFAEGCQKTSGNVAPFLAPAAGRRIHGRHRMCPAARLPPPGGLLQAAQREVATDIKLPEYPV